MQMQGAFEEESNRWDSQNLDAELNRPFVMENNPSFNADEAAASLRATIGAPILPLVDFQASIFDVSGEFSGLEGYDDLSPSSLGRALGLDSEPSGNNINGLDFLGVPDPRMHSAANVDLMHMQQGQQQAVELPPNDIQVNGQMEELVAEASDDQLKNRLFPRNEPAVLEDWEGDYGFTVKPFVNSLKDKKMEYLEGKKKLFCTNAKTVPFAIHLDYAKIPQELKIRVCMMYEGADYFTDPVERCWNHYETERKLTSEDKMFRLPHVVRPVPADAPEFEYYTNPESKRSYLLFPLTQPAVGMDYLRKDFCFTCLNSCESIKRRDTSLMFSLYDNSGNLMGRSVTHLRVCSAPGRDAKKEDENEGVKLNGRKRKSDPKVKPSTPPMKKVALAQGPSLRCTVTAPVDDDELSSSQEVYSSDESHEEKIRLKRLVQDIKWALGLKISEDPKLRAYSQHIFQSLKLTQQLCTAARNQAQLSTLKEEERSPDGGFHDAGME